MQTVSRGSALKALIRSIGVSLGLSLGLALGVLSTVVTLSCSQATIDSQVDFESVTQTPAKTETQSMSKSLITRFDTPTEAEQWWTVNDNVMGGLSQSAFSITPEGTGLFRGTLSLENNGGFTSVRRAANGADFAEANALSLRVKGDGRRYQLRLKMNNSDRAPSYRAEFDTRAGEWLTVSLPIDSFEPVFRGRVLKEAPDLVTTEIQQIGFLLSESQSGPFELEIDWIEAVI